MKVYVIFLTTICLLCSTPAFANDPAQQLEKCAPSEIGRYQLFNGTYKTFNLKSALPVGDTSTGIFLIDTKTGVVKRYLNMIDENGKYIETWVNIDSQQRK